MARRALEGCCWGGVCCDVWLWCSCRVWFTYCCCVLGADMYCVEGLNERSMMGVWDLRWRRSLVVLWCREIDRMG